MDFVVSNGDDDTLWLYLGRGDGTFKAPQIIPLTQGVTPVGIVAADLRGRGILDLVVANHDSWTVGILYGNGDGTFSYEHSYTVPLPPTCLTVTDLNRDGHLDIAIGLDSSNLAADGQIYNLATLMGDGTGNFRSFTYMLRSLETAPWSISAGDFNGDGFPDLVTSDPAGARLILNTGAGYNFRDAESNELNILVPALGDLLTPLTTDVGDINEDGCLDTVTGTITGAMGVVNIGDCSGHFSAGTPALLGEYPGAIALADVNNDGHLDVIGVSYRKAFQLGVGDVSNNIVSVSLGDGKGHFSRARLYRGTGPFQAVGLADFNQDHVLDIVGVSSETDSVSVFNSDSTNGYGFPQGVYTGWPTGWQNNGPTVNVPDAYAAPTITDLNGDGIPDIFLISNADGDRNIEIGSLLGDGTGRFAFGNFTPTLVPWPSVGDYHLADYRKTGRLDFLAIGLSEAFIAFAPNLGDGTFGPTVKTGMPNAIGRFAVGDFNGDGILDIATAKQVFLGKGDGSFQPGPLLTGASSALYLYAVDVNRDGILDLMMYGDADTGGAWEYPGKGDGSFAPGIVLFATMAKFSMPDVNHDGLPDLFAYTSSATSTPLLQTSFGRSDGTFGPLTETSTPYSGSVRAPIGFWQDGPNNQFSVTADLNADGYPDVIAFQTPPNSLQHSYAQIMMNNGDGTFTPTYNIVDLTGQGIPGYAADLDGDGKPELLEWDGGISALLVMKTAVAPSFQMLLEAEEFSGTSGHGRIYLNTPSTGATVALSTSRSDVTVPSSIAIPSGQLYGDFQFDFAPNFDPSRVFDIQAQLGNDTAIAYGSKKIDSGFAEQLSSSSVEVYAGETSTPITVTLSSNGNYTSTAALSCRKLWDYYTGTCEFNPPQVTIPAGGSASAQLVIHAAHGVRQDIVVVASDGTYSQYAPLTVSVSVLTLWVNGSTPVLSPGTAYVSIFVGGIPPIQLTCSGLPQGASCDFTKASQGTLSVIVPAGLPVGTYPFTVTATSSTKTVSAAASFGVLAPPDFAVDAPTSINAWAPPGGTATRFVNLRSLNNFAGTIQTTCTTSWNGACSAGNATLTGNGEQSLNLNVAVPAGVAPGKYLVHLNATSGTITHSADLDFMIADVTAAASQTSFSMAPRGNAITSLTLSGSPGFNGTLQITCNAPVQLSCSVTPDLLTVSSVPQVVTVNITASASATNFSPTTLTVWAVMLTAPFLGFGAGLSKRNLRLLGILLLVVVLNSCGGGGGGGSNQGSGTGGSPSSTTYTVSVTGAIGQTTVVKSLGNFTVTVQR